jgi:type IV secretion system protein VirD4
MLQRMTLVTGFDPDEAEQDGPAPGKGRSALAVRDPALPSSLAAAGRGIARFGGGYAAAVGATAAATAAAGLPVELSAAVALGACGMHAAARLTETMTWASKGGRAAQRRRRKYQGAADPLHVRERLSPAAAAKKMKRLAPDLPAAQAFISVGTTAHSPRQRVAISRAESVACFGVPQTYKTALIGNWILEAPGVVLATSSRGDQWRQTVAHRESVGQVLVLDATRYGPGTTFTWSPADGCDDPETAIRRAGDFMHASARDPGGKDKWHEQRGAALLSWALHAAALAGANMMDVKAWIGNPEDELFRKALRAEGAAPGWAAALDDELAKGGEYVNSMAASAGAALDWMRDPKLAALACPDAGTGLDIAAFLRAERPGTIYLIGAERPYGSLTPFFSAFSAEFFEQLRCLAEQQGGKLRVPPLLALDEAATCAKVDLKSILTVSAGYNITVVAGFQAISQLEDGWGGGPAAETILTCFSSKIVGQGFTNPAELDRLSVICLEQETWRRQGGVKVPETERVFPAGRLRMLPDLNVVLVQRNCKPVQCVVTPVWEHPLCRPVTVAQDQPEHETPAATATTKE